jgi:hypothetical protein
MNTRLCSLATCLLSLAAAATLHAEQEPQAPVPVTTLPAQAAPAPGTYNVSGQITLSPVGQQPQPQAAAVENQRLYGPGQAALVTPEQAKALIEKFKAGYEKLGSPRILFFVNRELVDTSAGLKLNGRTEKYEESKNTSGPAKTETESSVKTSGENSYTLKDSSKPTLADRQTTREVERLFGRAFRAAGASLADQKVAADLIADKSIGSLTGTNDQAAKDREALSQVADMAIEILVSSRTGSVTRISGDEQVSIPDIQVTAIRLKDAAILGQASSSDILGKGQAAATLAQSFDVRDITEATALALMEDMLTSVK